MRLLTWNLHAGVGSDGRLDLQRIAAEIRAADPDLAALQEVDAYKERSGGTNQWRVLGQATGLAAFYGPNLQDTAQEPRPGLPGRWVRQYGNAVLTRLPVRAAENHLLTYWDEGEGYKEQRGCLEIDTAGVTFLATHLGLVAAERVAQVADLLALAADAEARGQAVCILGDLNAISVSPEIAALRARCRDAGAGAGATIPAEKPLRRIDYCFVPQGWTVTRAEVLPTEASDHAPVLVEVEP